MRPGYGRTVQAEICGPALAGRHWTSFDPEDLVELLSYSCIGFVTPKALHALFPALIVGIAEDSCDVFEALNTLSSASKYRRLRGMSLDADQRAFVLTALRSAEREQPTPKDLVREIEASLGW